MSQMFCASDITSPYAFRLGVVDAQDSNIAHAVVVGEWNGVSWISSNGKYSQIPNVESAREIVINEFNWQNERVDMYCGSQSSIFETSAFIKK